MATASHVVIGDENMDSPSVFINTLPKSASVYLWDALSHGLGLRRMRISGGWFPDDLVVPEQVKLLAEGGSVTHEHLPASALNLMVLDFYLDRLVVHVRDPRMATLELVHHWITMEPAMTQPERDGHPARSFADPKVFLPDFYSLSMEEKIDWEIEHVLPIEIQWIEGWLDASEDPFFRPEILFTCYEDFVADEEAFFGTILDFYGVDRAGFAFAPFTPEPADDPALEGQYHFRNARTDEWREAFSRRQLRKACKMMPDRLLMRFGWPAR